MTNVIILLQGLHWGWFAYSHPLIGFHSDLGGRPSGTPCPPTCSREGCPASSPSGERLSSTKVQGQGWHPAKVILAEGPEKYQVLTIHIYGFTNAKWMETSLQQEVASSARRSSWTLCSALCICGMPSVPPASCMELCLYLSTSLPLTPSLFPYCNLP